jgi:hypothetical protein
MTENERFGLVFAKSWSINSGIGDIVDSGIGFSYRPASLCSLAVRQPYAGEMTLCPRSGTMNLATESDCYKLQQSDYGEVSHWIFLNILFDKHQYHRLYFCHSRQLYGIYNYS